MTTSEVIYEHRTRLHGQEIILYSDNTSDPPGINLTTEDGQHSYSREDWPGERTGIDWTLWLGLLKCKTRDEAMALILERIPGEGEWFDMERTIVLGTFCSGRIGSMIQPRR